MVEGFVYVSDAKPPLTAGALAGQRAVTPVPGPPWIAVHHGKGLGLK